jgi:hypothetical protein
VPARVLHVVVDLVLAVPAEHDVAEAKAAVERRQEFFTREVLPSHDPVDVEDADLDVGRAALLDEAACVSRCADLPRLHAQIFVVP